MHIILVNGPPQSGKDTLGRLVVAELERRGRPARVEKFAEPIKRGAHSAYGLPPTLDTEHFNDCKDVPEPRFHGRTPREVYIAFSEAFMKPLHGDGIFGELLAQRLLRGGARAPVGPGACVVVTDSGFDAEAERLAEELGLSAESVTVARVSRPATSFEGDSRDYVAPHLADCDYQEFEVDNSGSIEDLEATAERIVDAVLPASAPASTKTKDEDPFPVADFGGDGDL